MFHIASEQKWVTNQSTLENDEPCVAGIEDQSAISFQTDIVLTISTNKRYFVEPTAMQSQCMDDDDNHLESAESGSNNSTG